MQVLRQEWIKKNVPQEIHSKFIENLTKWNGETSFGETYDSGVLQNCLDAAQEANAKLIAKSSNLLEENKELKKVLGDLVQLIDKLEMSGSFDHMNPYSFKLDAARRILKNKTE